MGLYLMREIVRHTRFCTQTSGLKGTMMMLLLDKGIIRKISTIITLAGKGNYNTMYIKILATRNK